MKKSLSVPVFIIMIILLGVVWYFVYNKNLFDENKVFVEYYYYSGGMVELANPNYIFYIKITPNKAKLTNSDSSYSKVIDINNEKITELKELINSYDLAKLENDIKLSDKGQAVDGGECHITIYLGDKKYKLGGYEINNTDFNIIKDKIVGIVGENQIKDFQNNYKGK